jgi:hypothetical protein
MLPPPQFLKGKMMQLEKQIIVDKIEVKELGVVYAEMALRVKQGNKFVTQTSHSVTILPGEDYSSQDASIQAVCVSAHTPQVIAAYAASKSNPYQFG